MHHVMFDIDGTLVESYDLDSLCFVEAVKEVTGLSINSDWSAYQHVSDSGILNEVLQVAEIPDHQAVAVRVKALFLKKLKRSLSQVPVKEVAGANQFIRVLRSMDNITLSLATGGWQESAILKLSSAGIDCSGIPIASASDHYSRVEIMKLAAELASNSQYPCTYFGDGVWDKAACDRLGYHFVLVGNKFSYSPAISDFQSVESVLACGGV